MRFSKVASSLMGLILLGAFATPIRVQAQSTAIQYTFTYANNASLGTILETFQFTTPDFITNDVFVDATSLDYCSVTGMEDLNIPISTPCWGVAFLPSHPGSGSFPSAEIDVASYFWNEGSYGGGAGANYFPSGSFSSVGEYDVLFSNYRYAAHLSVKQVTAPQFPANSPVQVNPFNQNWPRHFYSFTAKVEIQPDGFQVKSQFALPDGDLDPVNSNVAFRIGSFFGNIPIRSFARKNSGYVFAGIVAGVPLHAIIKPPSNITAGNSTYALHVEGQNVDLRNSSIPVYLALSVGNFTGAAVIERQSQ